MRPRKNLRSPIPRRTTRTARHTGHASLSDQAYERLKLGIISLKYRPGAYLNEAKISEDLGFGRTPVHHAVTRLALEKMVEIIPRKGIIVSPVSLQEVLASVEVRLILEPNCARLAAERGTEHDALELSSILRGAERMVEARDVMALMDIDRRFHSRLAQTARNPILESILKRLHEQSLRFWFISLSDPGHMSGVAREHVEILEAIRDHDPVAAEATMRAHIESFVGHIRTTV